MTNTILSFVRRYNVVPLDKLELIWVATEKVHQLAEAEHSTRDPEKESP
jgi:hypothetical protein